MISGNEKFVSLAGSLADAWTRCSDSAKLMDFRLRRPWVHFNDIFKIDILIVYYGQIYSTVDFYNGFIWSFDIDVRGKRGSGLQCFRRYAVKGDGERATNTHWPHRAYGTGGTPITGNASEVSIGDAAFSSETICRSSVFLSPLLWKDFTDRSHTCRFDVATLGIDWLLV